MPAAPVADSLALPAGAHPDLRRLLPDRRSALAGCRSEATLRKYSQAFNAFRLWCADKHANALPADPLVVALFLAEKRRQTSSASALEVPLAAIGFFHEVVGTGPGGNP